MSDSDEDDRGQAKPEKDPFFDESEVIRPRGKRVKPPPGIISAGGVDMARAHASGIKLRDAVSPAPITDQPRVVVAVEVDPRKVPTHKRLVEGRDSSGDGTRAAMLPGHGSRQRGSKHARGTVHGTFPATPASGSAVARGARSQEPPPGGGDRPQAAEPEAPIEPELPHPLATQRKPPMWARVALSLTLLVVLIGVARRYRETDTRSAAEAPAGTVVISPPPAPVEPVTSPPPRPTLEAPSVLVEAPPVAVPVVASTRSASASDAPVANAGAARRPVKPLPLPPRATFTPPFQLPGEKN